MHFVLSDKVALDIKVSLPRPSFSVHVGQVSAYVCLEDSAPAVPVCPSTNAASGGPTSPPNASGGSEGLRSAWLCRDALAVHWKCTGEEAGEVRCRLRDRRERN